jgi:hypothetical protein
MGAEVAYLFRAGNSRTFAYLLDVTGRNIPPAAAGIPWTYQGTIDTKKLKPYREALRRLHADGFYLLQGS